MDMEKSEEKPRDYYTSSDYERNDNEETSDDEDSDSYSEMFSHEVCEANQEEGITMRVILPDGTAEYKKVYPSETAYEFKEKCLAGNYLKLQDFTVFLCNDDDDDNDDDTDKEKREKSLSDEKLFTDLLEDYQFIRIRHNESEELTNEALNPVVKMKPQDGVSTSH